LNVDELITFLARGATTRDGEALDLLAHALQCAELLADQRPDDIELQIAGLVHDLGTLLEPDKPATHAKTGGGAIEDLLGPRISALVAGHDQAKRYLVATDPAYAATLSEISRYTFTLQGGDMGAGERAEFERGAHFEDLLVLRRADDDAKVAGRIVPGLGIWRPEITKLAARV